MARSFPTRGPAGGSSDLGAPVRIEHGSLGIERSVLLATALALAGIGIWLAVPGSAPTADDGSARHEAGPVARIQPGDDVDRAPSPAAATRSVPGVPPPPAAGLDSASGGTQPNATLPRGDALRRAQRPGRTEDGQRYRPDRKTDAEIDAVLDGAERGDTAGIGVFPPTGTKPVKSGLIVPEGVELPPGYVRHYQTTDDGRMLPPILAYHPDYTPTDAAGNPLPRPPGGVVPPEQAPEGLRGGEVLIPPPPELAPIQAPGDRPGAR